MSAASRRRIPLCLLLAALAAGGGGPAAAQPPGPETIPAPMRPYVPTNLRGYFIVFLMAPAQPRPIGLDLFARHEAYIRRQFEAGAFRVAGPLMDNGRIRGLYIVSAPTREAALALVGGDPIVPEGGFTMEAHPALFPDLSSVRPEYPAGAP
jgi:uncharacterized protein YciI